MQRARAAYAFAVAFAAAAIVFGCHSEPLASAPQRACGVTVWYRPAGPSSRVEVVGSWAAYARPGQLMTAGRADGYRVAHFDVPPGEHTYAIVDDGTWLPNPNVPTTAFHEGREVTWVSAPDCETPALRIESVTTTPEGIATIEASFLAANSGSAVDPSSVTLTRRDGAAFAARPSAIVAAEGHVRVAVAGLASGKHTFILAARDTVGRVAESARATAWIEPRPFDLRDAVI
jgi:hypothetical protein